MQLVMPSRIINIRLIHADVRVDVVGCGLVAILKGHCAGAAVQLHKRYGLHKRKLRSLHAVAIGVAHAGNLPAEVGVLVGGGARVGSGLALRPGQLAVVINGVDQRPAVITSPVVGWSFLPYSFHDLGQRALLSDGSSLPVVMR